MTYVNVGALSRDGVRYPSKKALREALKADPSEVIFDPTSILGPITESICGDSIPQGVKLSVCGPDPYESRKWFATAEWTAAGPRLS